MQLVLCTFHTSTNFLLIVNVDSEFLPALQTRQSTEVVPDAASGARVADGDARDVAETQH